MFSFTIVNSSRHLSMTGPHLIQLMSNMSTVVITFFGIVEIGSMDKMGLIW